jgi:hypothetical protein
LGQNGAFFLDMEIIGKLTVLSKIQSNPNNIDHYKLCSDIIVHIDLLKDHIEKTGNDHSAEFNQLTSATYYTHLETIKKSVLTYQETTFPCLHSARHLITSLQQLKKADSKEYGALRHLLTSLEETFRDEKLPAYEKLKTMMQQVNYSYHAIKTNRALSLTFFGMPPKTNPLVPVLETFIQQDMASLAKLNGISLTEERTPSFSARNSSTNP